MTNKFLIVANWKANTVSVSSWLSQVRVVNEVEVAVAAPFTSIFLLASGEAPIASQDVSQYPLGAYTGEVPAELLKELGVSYGLIGHSERRKYFGETTETIEKKMARLLECEITPIVCAQSLEEIPQLAFNTPGEKYAVMFEPFEAISKDGKYNAVASEVVSATIQEWKGKLPKGVKFLYGGSVNIANAMLYRKIVDGYVVGHASLDPEEFFKIIEACTLPIDS